MEQSELLAYEELLECVDAEPFRPFRVRMASGHTFDVRDPEGIRLGLRCIAAFQHLQHDERHKKFCEASKALHLQLMESLQQMESIELIDAPVSRGHE